MRFLIPRRGALAKARLVTVPFFLMGAVVACGSPATSSTAAATFQGCANKSVALTPTPRSGVSGQSVPASTTLSESDALSFVHEILLQPDVTVHGTLTCTAKQVSQAAVQSELGQVPGLTPTIWIVIVHGNITFKHSATLPSSANGPVDMVFYISGNRPLTVYRESVYYAGLPAGLTQK
jgi:hypothetical protein